MKNALILVHNFNFYFLHYDQKTKNYTMDILVYHHCNKNEY
jgi:hypothetical protein